ncbi:MAG: hypothetical protein EOP68_12400 [Sphingomonas sp.]|nr:MAG: hypothetical protein EOP68_12400 [Sphingomonas sp.]
MTDRDHSAAHVRVRLPGERRSLSRSATRALDVLELFGDVRRALRAVEIARALDLTASTTHQLLKTMVDSAHLLFDAASKSYVPSPRLAGFGVWVTASYGTDQRIRTLMEDIHYRTREAVTLAAPNDLFMLIVDRAGWGETTERAERGLRISIFGSALGTAFLASLAEAEVRRLALRARIAEARMAAALEAVARARRAGVADGPSPNGEAWSLAVSLPVQGQLAPLVLGLSGPSGRIRERLDELRGELRDAARPPA